MEGIAAYAIIAIWFGGGKRRRLRSASDFETIVFCDALGKTVFGVVPRRVRRCNHNATLLACFDTTALVRVDATTWAVTTHDLGCFAPFRGQAATVLAANCLHVAVGFTDGSVGLFDTALSCVHFVYTPAVYGLCAVYPVQGPGQQVSGTTPCILLAKRAVGPLPWGVLQIGTTCAWRVCSCKKVNFAQRCGRCCTRCGGRGQVAMVKALLVYGTPMTNEALINFVADGAPVVLPLFQLLWSSTAKGTKVLRTTTRRVRNLGKSFRAKAAAV